MKKVSIIVPVYNVEQYVEQCIRSLYAQDIPQDEYEVICVDDCSPDGSRAIVERLQTEYPTLRLICHERNKKLGGARNTGIRAAQGKYIMFVDSDDYLLPNILDHLVREMEMHNADYIHFNSVIFYADGNLGKEQHYSCDLQVGKGVDLFFCESIPWQHQVCAWRKIYRTSFVRENNLYFVEDIMYEDNDYAFRLAASAQRCQHIDYTAYVYRQNDQSVTGVSVNPQRLLYWQKTWPLMLNLYHTLPAVDARFEGLIRFYLRYDLYDVLTNMQQLPSADRKVIKRAMSAREWYRVIRLLPLKRQIEYIFKLLCA